MSLDSPNPLDAVLSDFSDPVDQILLRGEAKTVAEAIGLYLDRSIPEAIRLLESGLSHEELGRHPLMVLYRQHGSRPREDDVL